MPDIELALSDDKGQEIAEAHVPVPAGEGMARFRAAVQKVERGGRMRRASQVMADVRGDPTERFTAVVDLNSALAHETLPHRAALIKALKKKEEGAFDGFADRCVTELYIQGSVTFHFFTPRKLGGHRRWVTWAVALLVFTLFAYQAGIWVAYLASRGAISSQCLATPQVTNANGLLRWVAPGNFCVDHELSADFLIRWGALWLPALRSQPWRLWTSLALHQNLYHVATNLFMWLLLAAYVEKVFGWWRLTILTFVAGTGGALMTAAFDKACTANVGLSGADFGLLGVFLVDLVENVRVSKRAIIRSVMTAILLILLIAGSVTAPNVSQWAHLGGFLSGVAPSMVLLPRLGHAHVEAWIPLVGGLWTLAYFVSLLSYVFADRANGLGCGTPDG